MGNYGQMFGDEVIGDDNEPRVSKETIENGPVPEPITIESEKVWINPASLDF